MSKRAKHTPGPWRIPVANVFRVIAPDAPHENKQSGMCPPYPWAVVCETDPESVGGEQAAANAWLIAAAPDLLAACEAMSDLMYTGYDSGNYTRVMEQVRAAIAKATGSKS